MAKNFIAPVTPVTRASLRERGMATVEYALGVVVVIVINGATVVAINTGSFSQLVDNLIGALMEWITGAFDLELLDFFRK